MKKIKLAVLTAAFSFLLGMEAMAAGSSEGNVQWDGNSSTVSVVTSDGSVSEQEVIPVFSSISGEDRGIIEASHFWGEVYNENCSVYMLNVDLVLKSEKDNPDRTIVHMAGGTIRIGFGVPGVTPDSKVTVLHKKSSGQVETVRVVAAHNNYVQAQFTSLSPVAIIVENEPKEESKPDTSDNSDIYEQGAQVGDIRVKKSGAGVQATVVRADGQVVTTIVHPFLMPGTRTVSLEQAQKILGTKSGCAIYVLDLSIVDAAGDYSQVTLKEGAVPVTFYVPGVTPQSRVVVRHWINGTDKYEDVPVELGSGTVTATFTSFSPVVIMVAQDGAPVTATATAGTSTGRVSPKTAESSWIYVVEAVALLSFLGLAVCRKKAHR